MFIAQYFFYHVLNQIMANNQRNGPTSRQPTSQPNVPCIQVCAILRQLEEYSCNSPSKIHLYFGLNMDNEYLQICTFLFLRWIFCCCCFFFHPFMNYVLLSLDLYLENYLFVWTVYTKNNSLLIQSYTCWCFHTYKIFWRCV